MRTLVCVIALGLVACKARNKDEGAPPPSAQPDPGSGSAAGPASASGAAALTPDATTADERCGNPCRFLADTPLTAIAAKVKATCNADWPMAPSDCAQLDYQRNCIYATAGYAFKKMRYKIAFGGEAWYTARADFKESDLSATATANVAALKQNAASCRKGSKIAEADRKVIDAWLAKLRAGKPEIPAIVFDGAVADGATDVTEMKTRLVANKADFAAKKLKSMTYRDLAGMREEWMKPLAGKQVRIVELDFSDSGGNDCGDEECGYGLWLILAIDDRDQVVALEEGMAACPLAYLMTQRGPELEGEILRNLAGVERELTQALPVTAKCGGRLTFRIAEEKPEVTRLDELVLVVDGEVVGPVRCGALCANDGRAEVLRPGEHLDVEFDTPATCKRIALRANGHYTPIRQ